MPREFKGAPISPTAELHIRSGARHALGTSAEADVQLHRVGTVSLRVQPGVAAPAVSLGLSDRCNDTYDT